MELISTPSVWWSRLPPLMAMEPIRPCYLSLSLSINLSRNRSPNNFIRLNSRWRQSSEILKMPEILQILHQSPPSHHQMPPHLQRDLVNVESQFNWLIDSALPSFDVTDHFQWCEFDGIDELSKVTAINDQNQSSKKRKLEFDVVEVKAEKQRDELKGDSKPKIDPKADYIHVRARRGQATDNHSLAERARREKIKKKMQDLQDLVPGCNKITNKAAILDEIITYVQCLQREVESLTMKLAASTTSVDFNSLHEQFAAYIANFQQQQSDASGGELGLPASRSRQD